MHDYIEILERMSAVQYRINYNDRKPKSFGTDQMLYHSEIHFIEAIEVGDINASTLSKKLDITNGAVTQVAEKLIKKGLILKYKRDSNKKEVLFKLTEKGKIAYENHELFHKQLNDKVIEYLKGLSKEQVEGILGLIGICEEHLPRIL
ncbi:MarR family winged helix-turn-helix transcriptional regulator [Vallitalea guaymasensis]|uniref:MarR family winged helix-turn-helix transcriptional regulator n=1 Tax=Vallitalea guaymasensis TaxID=1185412 RepID=UPI000DE2BF61|nr:MarR family transcriptional regulator [Vallitalea guaymasensis]